MTDTQAELREKIAAKLAPHMLMYTFDPDCETQERNRQYALDVADAILALLPPAPAVSEAVPLKACPPGLFLWNGILCFRSEYATMTETNLRQPDAYVVESGEYFWGGVSDSRSRDELMVQPVAPTPPSEGK